MAPPKVLKMILLDTGYWCEGFCSKQPHSTIRSDTRSAPYDHQKPRDLIATPTSEGQMALNHHKPTYDLHANTLTFTDVFMYCYMSMIMHQCIWKRIITTGPQHILSLSLSVRLSTSVSLGEWCCWRLLSILHVKDLWSYPSSDHLPGKWPDCRGYSSWSYLFSSIWHFHDNYWKQGNLDIDFI